MRLSLVLLILTSLSAAARTAADFFISAPAAVMGSLTRNARQEMLINYLGGSERTVQNNFGSQSRLTTNMDDLVTVELTPNSAVSIAVLPAKSDTVIALIETVANPVPDSRIALYTTDWTPSDRRISPLEVKDFVSKADRKKAEKADMPEMAFYTITYSPDEKALIFANTTAKYYTRGERPEGLDLMQPTITFRWNGKKFDRK